jgi:hypothetical protein
MRTVLALSEQNRLVIALPLIRLMVENAVTSIWLYLEPENVRAVIHEGLRLRKAALENVLETAAEGYDQSDVDEVAEEMEAYWTACLTPCAACPRFQRATSPLTLRTSGYARFPARTARAHLKECLPALGLLHLGSC